MLPKFLWSLALTLVPIALTLRSLGFFEAADPLPEPVPVEIDRPADRGAEPR